ncbi:MAG TPA: TlpA disulfide reductase family protein [Ramlibacter sp.]|nr:TlpA disulfide reductase family protein [Ramlibacter sp.]
MNTDTTPAAAAPTGRRLLFGAVAAAAAVAGGGLAWWRSQPAPADAAGLQQFWTLEFDTPAGGKLAMAGLRGKPLLVNFWATWCPPCVEELPLIDRFYRENAAKGWQTVGLAIDQPSAVRAFLARAPVAFPVGMAGLGGTELGKALGNLSGGLPFTVLIGSDGNVRQRRMGRVTEADLQQWVRLS